jgi:hypothetical protein
MKKPETKFKEKVLGDLKELPVWFIKTQEVARCGTPDLLICAGGVFVAWELKTDEGEPDGLQLYNIKRINDANGVGLVVSPENYKTALEQLKGYL